MAMAEKLSEHRYAESALIPSERYTSRDWMEREYEHLWPRVWQVACREEQVPNVGDYHEYGIGDQSILIVRESAHSLRAFQNSCLHRGMRLKDEGSCGNTGSGIQCRYHGFKWNLDGSIRAIPDRRDFAPECVIRDELRLREVHVDTWGGFVFVNFDAEPPPLLEYLSPIPDVLAPFELEKMRLFRYRSTVLACNWKTGLDAFSEPYHFEATHVRDLSGAAASMGIVAKQNRPTRDSTGTSIGGYAFHFECYDHHNMFRFAAEQWGKTSTVGELGPDPKAALLSTMERMRVISLCHQEDIDYVRALDKLPLDLPSDVFLAAVRREVGRARGIDYSHIPDADLTGSIQFTFFPNLVGPALGGNSIMFRFRPNGNDPDSCIWDLFFLHRFAPGEEPNAIEYQICSDWRDLPVEEWGPVLLQDIFNMPQVQRGMHQRSFPGLRLNRMEQGVRNHERVLARYVGDR